MKNEDKLSLEISLLRERLEKAVFFEITEDITIGMSEADGLFRIRRIDPDGETSFLNKSYQWEQQARHIDLAYSERTGYYTSDEAFDVLELIQDVDSPIVIPPNTLKNN